jgi:hypothetical protein
MKLNIKAVRNFLAIFVVNNITPSGKIRAIVELSDFGISFRDQAKENDFLLAHLKLCR